MGRVKFQTVTGMHDILGEDWCYFNKIFETVEKIASFYNFERIETPILEKASLFEKGTGQTTDIVQKEMYTLKTKEGKDILALRPEGTPPVVRAYLQHGLFNLPQPVKLWYFGPYFRHERPQAGRYREFWQFGFEVIGGKSPAIDAQIIKIFQEVLEEIGLKKIIFEVNSLGDSQCRPYYKKILVNFLKKKERSLCRNCRKRLRKNPLRVLDCKEEKCQRIAKLSPQLIDHLCNECKEHFKEVLEFLDYLNIPYNLNPFLVRGLDYYTKTVFEVFREGEEDSSVALGGGGRYDGLVKLLGGENTPACGGAGGVERIIEAMKEEGIFLKEERVEIFLAQLGKEAKKKSLQILEEFRKANIKIKEAIGKDSLKSQLKLAHKFGAKYALILGQKEVMEDKIIIRDMESGKQRVIKIKNLIKEVKKLLKKKK